MRLLRREAGDLAGPALDDLIAGIDGTPGPRLVIGRLLGHFSESFEKLWTDAFVRSAIPAPARRMLLAVREFPEFRPAARVAVLEACGRPGALEALACRLAPMLPLVASDLTGEGLSRAIGNPREFVTNLVAYADRCQLLYRLLGIARELNPDCRRVELVLQGMARWLTPSEAAFYLARPAERNATPWGGPARGNQAGQASSES